MADNSSELPIMVLKSPVKSPGTNVDFIQVYFAFASIKQVAG